MINGIDPNHYLSMIRQLDLVKGKESSLQTKALDSAKESKASKMAAPDVLFLSPSAKQLSDFFATQEVADSENANNENAGTDLDGMKLRGEILAESLQMQLNAFQGKMIGMLNSAGFDTNSQLNIQANAAGHLQVTNDHPEKLEIEALLQKSPGLSKEFREISMLATVVRANGVTQKSNDMFGSKTNWNPLSMAAQYTKNSTAANSDRFNLRIAEGQASYYFG